MKISNKIEKIILVLSFVLIITFPYFTYLFNINKENETSLSGSEEKVELTFESIDDYILQNFPGRENLIKTKNQLLYSLFDISPNANITKTSIVSVIYDVAEALSGNYAPVCQTVDGAIYIYSKVNTAIIIPTIKEI